MNDPSTTTEPVTQIKQDKLLCYAWDIANEKANGKFIYCMEEDIFYQYKDGVWKHIFDLAFLAHVSHHIKEVTRLTLPRRKQILDNYKLIKYKTLSELNTSELLNLQNYMIDVRGSNVLKHEPEYYSTIQLPYKYDALAKCDLWLKTLEEIFEGDKKRIDILQEFVGYCLVPDVEQKKALLLLGDSDTGKSTILFTIRDLIGQMNCSSVPLKYLSNPQYTPMMVNKLVNIDADVAKDAANYEAEFKIITSGEPISCNQKFIETFDFIPRCKIILAANIFPRITDHSSAFYKRLILLPCDRIFDEPEKNRLLNIQLKQELSGILNWAMIGLRRLKARGMFEQHDFMKDAVQELENENNPCNLFFDEHVEVEMGSYTEKPILFNKYKDWSEKNKQNTVTHIVFSRNLFKRFHKHTQKQARLMIGNRPYIWKNLKYVEFKTNEIKEEIAWQDPAVAVDKSASPSTIAVDSQQGSINWES